MIEIANWKVEGLLGMKKDFGSVQRTATICDTPRSALKVPFKEIQYLSREDTDLIHIISKDNAYVHVSQLDLENLKIMDESSGSSVGFKRAQKSLMLHVVFMSNKQGPKLVPQSSC